jgi:hypothetical protein
MARPLGTFLKGQVTNRLPTSGSTRCVVIWLLLGNSSQSLLLDAEGITTWRCSVLPPCIIHLRWAASFRNWGNFRHPHAASMTVRCHLVTTMGHMLKTIFRVG